MNFELKSASWAFKKELSQDYYFVKYIYSTKTWKIMSGKQNAELFQYPESVKPTEERALEILQSYWK